MGDDTYRRIAKALLDEGIVEGARDQCFRSLQALGF
jgi:hypothetical protein